MKVDLYELNNECENVRTSIKLLQKDSDGRFLLSLNIINQLMEGTISTSLGIITGNYNDTKKKESAVFIATQILRAVVEIESINGIKNKEFGKIKVSLDKLLKMTQ